MTVRSNRLPKTAPGLDAEIKKRVAKATVRLTGTCGQGVLVSGGYILTAAHCITWDGRGGMALGDWHLEQVETKDGQTFRVSPCAVEPVTDIAVLAAPDDQAFTEDFLAYEKFLAATLAIAVSTVAHEVEKPRPAYILTHKGKWIDATLTRYGWAESLPGGQVHLAAAKHIEGGTSGGAVVDRHGRLIGVVSNTSEQPHSGCFDGNMPVAHLALPRWLWNMIEAEQPKRPRRE